MSGTLRRLAWNVIVDDTDRWNPAHVEAAEKAMAESSDLSLDYDDWVMSQMCSRMEAAGIAFVAENPDLFRRGLV